MSRFETNSQGFTDNNDSQPEIILDDPAETPPPFYSPNEPPRSSKPSIYDFLDEVEMKSVQQLELTSIGSASPSPSTPLGSSNNNRVKLPSLKPPPSSARSSDSNLYYGEIKEKLVTLNIELQDKTKTIELLKAARKKDKAKCTHKVEELEAHYKAKIKELQLQHDQDVEKHLEFEQTLVKDKSDLAMKCELLVVQLKNLQAQMAKEASDFERQLKDAKERWAASEKVRREQWMLKKTEEIKKSTIKALEPDVQAIMAKCRENIQKAQDAANEEKRRLILQHEKDKEELIIKEREATDKKLVEAREKERSKLMYRLDAADAELQQQLNAQRRRFQDEAEKARNDVVMEIRQLKQTHAKEMEEMRVVERQRIEYELQQLQKDKEELGKRYEADVALLREKYQSDLESAQASINATLRSEFDMEKKRLEQEMIRRRDEKIEMIIEKLQLETQRKVEAAEKLLAVQYDERAKEFEKKLRAASDMEVAWMEKNRDLYDRCTKLEADREQLKARFSEQAYGLQQANAQCAQLQQTLDQERSRHSHDEECQKNQWAKQKVDLENEQKVLQSVMQELQLKFEAAESTNARQLQELRANHDEILEKLHTRVRATVAKKDEMIDSLREQLHFSQIRLNKCEAIINEQRAQLIT